MTTNDSKDQGRDSVTREQVLEWGRAAGFESSLTREYNLERLADFAIFARQSALATSASALARDEASVLIDKIVMNVDGVDRILEIVNSGPTINGLFIRVVAATVSDAARDVLAERQRQVAVEGWTPEHDDEHESGELSAAAFGYLFSALNILGKPTPPDSVRTMTPPYWPWDASWFKPGPPRRMLEKAGALILAEIEHLDRAQSTNGEQS